MIEKLRKYLEDNYDENIYHEYLQVLELINIISFRFSKRLYFKKPIIIEGYSKFIYGLFLLNTTLRREEILTLVIKEDNKYIYEEVPYKLIFLKKLLEIINNKDNFEI